MKSLKENLFTPSACKGFKASFNSATKFLIVSLDFIELKGTPSNLIDRLSLVDNNFKRSNKYGY